MVMPQTGSTTSAFGSTLIAMFLSITRAVRSLRRWAAPVGSRMLFFRLNPHDAPAWLPEDVLAPRCAGARPGGHQSDLLAARSAHLPARHRSVRDAVPGIHHRRVLSRRQRAFGGGGR